jgi:hypothetical protein
MYSLKHEPRHIEARGLPPRSSIRRVDAFAGSRIAPITNLSAGSGERSPKEMLTISGAAWTICRGGNRRLHGTSMDQPPEYGDNGRNCQGATGATPEDGTWRLASRLSYAGRGPRGRCAPRTPCSRRRTGEYPRASVPARDWTVRPGSAGRVRRTAWSPRTATAP